MKICIQSPRCCVYCDMGTLENTDREGDDFPLPSADQARRIKRRLMDRVADADDSHRTINPEEGDWQPFGRGVQLKVLYERDGIRSYLLRLEAGARLAAHRHPVDEECVVLTGVLQVGTRIEIRPGGYHIARRGALHASISTRDGATMFLRGAIPEVHHVLD